MAVELDEHFSINVKAIPWKPPGFQIRYSKGPKCPACGRSKGKPYPHVHPRTETVNFEKIIDSVARQIVRDRELPVPLDQPIGIEILFVAKKPKSKFTKRDMNKRDWDPTKPDLDNLEKSTTDGIAKVFFKDDGRICLKFTRKIYGRHDEVPHIDIHVFTLRDVEPDQLTLDKFYG